MSAEIRVNQVLCRANVVRSCPRPRWTGGDIERPRRHGAGGGLCLRGLVPALRGNTGTGLKLLQVILNGLWYDRATIGEHSPPSTNVLECCPVLSGHVVHFLLKSLY